jgi:hypothetical protein
MMMRLIPTDSYGSALNCKSQREAELYLRASRQQVRRNQRARRERDRLFRGMEGRTCWMLTISRGRCLDLDLRRYTWHIILTRLRQRWPRVEAWTVYEYGERRGVHLHTIIKGVPGFTPEWLTYLVELCADGTQIHIQKTWGRVERLTRYLTKDLDDPQYANQWPRHFRPVSVTRRWCPDWLRERLTSR